MKNRLTYQVPELTIVEFRKERGYVGSDLSFAHEKIQTFLDEQMVQADNTTRDGEVAAGYFQHENQTDSTVSSGWQYSDGGWF